MKKHIIISFLVFFSIQACKENTIEKPKKLISKDKMVDIIYDLAVLEAAKSQTAGVYQYPRTSVFIKNKYQVDSLTFAQSTQYYAADMKAYKKIYDDVKKRLNENLAKANGGKIPKTPTETPGVLH